MNSKKIIMAGLANNKTSLGEVFRRYVECFRTFSNPDIFDLNQFSNNKEWKLDVFPQYTGPIDHDIKYFHTTFSSYTHIKSKTKKVVRPNGVKKIGFFVWESSELHEKDIPVLHDFDEIWTASNYCKDIFSQYKSEDTIKVVPHPIPDITKTYKKYKNFTLLIIGNISSNIDRKNIKENLEVAKILKQKYKNINIIFKTFTGSDAERDILKSVIQGYNIKVIDEYYTSEKVQELLAKCHMVLSLHRSEGFGLTLAEALATKTIPVCTGFSGNTDFITDERLLIDYKLVDVNNSYFKGKWAEPSLQDAIDKISTIIENGYPEDLLTNTLTYDRISDMIQKTL